MGRAMDCKDNLIEDNYNQFHIPMSPNVSPTSPLDLSTTSRQFSFHRGPPSPSNSPRKAIQISCRQMSVDEIYEAPEIITQPKEEWHYRSLKDLANKHSPYLSGNGRQRTPLRVKVPEAFNRPMYIAIAILTIDDRPHPSKIIVPAKTKVNVNHLSHDNNLDCLQFDECNSTDYFEQKTNRIYSEISSAEHQAGFKEIRIHMFNLYQNQLITKEMIVKEQLNQCKLSFWLCVRKDEDYIAISQPSFSIIIEEKKSNTRSRASSQINKSSMLFHPYAQFYIDCDDQGNTDNDNSS